MTRASKMGRWEIEMRRAGNQYMLLTEGWEPFAVTSDALNGEQIWFRRKATAQEGDK